MWYEGFDVTLQDLFNRCQWQTSPTEIRISMPFFFSAFAFPIFCKVMELSFIIHRSTSRSMKYWTLTQNQQTKVFELVINRQIKTQMWTIIIYIYISKIWSLNCYWGEWKWDVDVLKTYSSIQKLKVVQDCVVNRLFPLPSTPTPFSPLLRLWNTHSWERDCMMEYDRCHNTHNREAWWKM